MKRLVMLLLSFSVTFTAAAIEGCPPDNLTPIVRFSFEQGCPIGEKVRVKFEGHSPVVIQKKAGTNYFEVNLGYSVSALTRVTIEPFQDRLRVCCMNRRQYLLNPGKTKGCYISYVVPCDKPEVSVAISADPASTVVAWVHRHSDGFDGAICDRSGGSVTGAPGGQVRELSTSDALLLTVGPKATPAEVPVRVDQLRSGETKRLSRGELIDYAILTAERKNAAGSLSRQAREILSKRVGPALPAELRVAKQ